MIQRGFWFKRLFFLLILFSLVPLLAEIGYIAIQVSVNRPNGQWPITFGFEPFGLLRWRDPAIPSESTMARNQWCWIDYAAGKPNSIGIRFQSLDPDARPAPDSRKAVAIDSFQQIERSSKVGLHFPYYRIVADSQKIWLIGSSGEVLEYVDGKFVVHSTEFNETLAAALPRYSRYSDELFLLDGQSAVMILNGNGLCEVFQFRDGTWKSRGEIVLLDARRSWVDSAGRELLSAIEVPNSSISSRAAANGNTPKGTMASVLNVERLHVITIGSTPYLFWQTSNRLLYRRGIEFRTPSDQTNPTTSQESDSTSSANAKSSQSVTNDWIPVSEKMKLAWNEWFVVNIDGEPAVVIIDTGNFSGRPQPIATAWRIENQEWTKFSECELLFRTHNFMLGTRDDASKTYIAGVTGRGRVSVVTLDSMGFHPTGIDELGQSFDRRTAIDYWIAEGPWNFSGPWNIYILLICAFLWLHVAGLIVAIGTSLLMFRDPTEYQYGAKTAKLASVGSRAIAKLIDLSILVIAVVKLLQWRASTTQVDWEITYDAIQFMLFRLQFSFQESNLSKAMEIIWTCVFSLFAIWFLFAAMLGRWGVTPGKWICGLRTVRTTLSPCGFAKSLYREVLLPLDNLFFLTWVPGIARIAFSEKRQRFGDVAADTIVVTTRG